jgi:hypothetical protein
MYGNIEEIINLIQGFESGKLPRSQWTHQAHLTVGAWYLCQYDRADAREKIRNGIQHYNQSQGIVTTKDSGYHETITLFWIEAIPCGMRTAAQFLADFGDVPILDKVNRLLFRYQDQQLPFKYYSRELLMSCEARSQWVEPDLKPLVQEGNISLAEAD